MKFICLCGYPNSGKSTVARILSENFNTTEIDDSKIFREATIALHGVDHNDPYSQEGKLKKYNINGKEISVRELMKDIGVFTIATYGKEYKPLRAIEQTKGSNEEDVFVFSSVREDEAKVYKDSNPDTLVIEIKRPDCKPIVNADNYNLSYIDETLYNDSTLEDFEQKVNNYFLNILSPSLKI